MARSVAGWERAGLSGRGVPRKLGREWRTVWLHRNLAETEKSSIARAAGHSADALSLAREQVEKVFAIALLCEDPTRWAKVYLEHAWRRTFERYLLEKAERQYLPSFQNFFPQAYAGIEGMRQRLGIANDVRDAVEYKFFNPSDPPGGPPKHSRPAAAFHRRPSGARP